LSPERKEAALSTGPSPDAPEGTETYRAAAPDNLELKEERAATPETPEAETQTVARLIPGEEQDVEILPKRDNIPRFDLVRIELDGSAVIAGQAAPNAQVTIFANDAVIAEVKANPSGAFVAMVDAPVEDGTTVLRLRTKGFSGIERSSTENIYVLGRSRNTDNEPPTVVRSSDAGIKLERPSSLPKVNRVQLDVISYREDGEVVLSGRGRPFNTVRVYVDNRVQVEVQVPGSGDWQTPLEGLAEGKYTLRLDEIDAEGKVTSRLSSPFARSTPPEPAENTDHHPAQVTIQPGNNLWTIAENHYGSGVRYTRIYAANQDLIEDPDLIFPGQIFSLPRRDQEN
jgi:nucleoid-associated protein YgaU